eukprot:GHUV01024634.1.p1 GENE.GHUV01024634.1~~GHUV01024634.1.p1  ORF type:complete len:320 (+),score=51.49 GHUV01024634.1:1096-2055(+)
MQHEEERLLLQVIHEGGLINKLKGCMPVSGGYTFPLPMHGPEWSVDMLGDFWTNKCHTLSDELYKRIQDDEARSTELRLLGNFAFKDGRLQEALQHYWKAVALNPQDASLSNNISLAYTKLEQASDALLAAREALKPDPTVSKSWVRLGDAYRLIGKWQLAHLSYTAALELAPGHEEYLARQSEAREHLAVIWDFDKDVPHGTRDLMSPRYIEWTGLKHSELMGLSRGHGDAYDALDRLLQTSRAEACLQLKGDIEDMRAIAVATGLIPPSRLPSSCRGLKQLQEIPIGVDHWSLSWTDMPLRHPGTGLIRPAKPWDLS